MIGLSAVSSEPFTMDSQVYEISSIYHKIILQNSQIKCHNSTRSYLNCMLFCRNTINCRQFHLYACSSKMPNENLILFSKHFRNYSTSQEVIFIFIANGNVCKWLQLKLFLVIYCDLTIFFGTLNKLNDRLIQNVYHTVEVNYLKSSTSERPNVKSDMACESKDFCLECGQRKKNI